MKIAKLPNGRTLPFDPSDDDETIDRTVKAYMGVKDAPDAEEMLLTQMTQQIVSLQGQLVATQQQMIDTQEQMAQQVALFTAALNEMSQNAQMYAGKMEEMTMALRAPKVVTRDSKGMMLGVSSVMNQENNV